MSSSMTQMSSSETNLLDLSCHLPLPTIRSKTHSTVPLSVDPTLSQGSVEGNLTSTPMPLNLPKSVLVLVDTKGLCQEERVYLEKVDLELKGYRIGGRGVGKVLKRGV
jgi:hypothetical protein